MTDKDRQQLVRPELTPDQAKVKFANIRSDIWRGPEKIMELFEFFGEPGRISPASEQDVIFHYELGDIHVRCSSLIKKSERMRIAESVEMAEPWAFSATGKWERFDDRCIIAHFELDRVPGSDFNQIVAENLWGNYPPQIVHDRFDMLSDATKQVIIAEIMPLVPTPEKSAQCRWKQIEKDSGVDEWRRNLVSLQAAGEPSWHGERLQIGARNIDLEHFYIGRDPEFFGLEPKDAVTKLIGKSRRMLALYLDPLDYSFVPKEDEPLLGIPNVAEWRGKFAAEFEKLKEAANWEAIDEARVRRLEAAPVAKNIVGRIDLPQTARYGSRRESRERHSRQPSLTNQAPTATPEVKREVDENGWFTCNRGHKNKLGQYGMERLKKGEQVKLKCDGCDCCVGFAQNRTR